MTRRTLVRPVAVLAVFGALVLAFHLGCTPEPEQVRLVPNQPPRTVVSGAPLDSSNAFHRYQMFWAGFDADGTIAEYWIAVTDSNMVPAQRDFRRTLRTDTIIEFVANNEVVLSHRFWAYAVDNEGDRDPDGAWTFFNAVDTNRPIPIITGAEKYEPGTGWTPMSIQGPSSTAIDTISSEGSMVRINWAATDPDIGGMISGYRIKLNLDNQFTEIPEDSTSIVYDSMASGSYQFLVHAIDNAGAESLEPASLRWIVNFEPRTEITQMFVSNAGGFREVTDFRDNPPTLRDSSRVTLFFEGTDVDGTVIDYAIREGRCDIVRLSCVWRPFGSFFPETSVSLPAPAGGSQDTTSLFFASNDWYLVVRSRDNEGKADGRVDTLNYTNAVFFHVNYTPTLDDSGLYPGDGEVVQSAGQDELTIRFLATDLESESFDMTYRVVLDGVWGRTVGPVAEADSLFEVWPMPEPGEHQLVYQVTDPGRRVDQDTVMFTVVDTAELPIIGE